ncbi:MAG: flagellar filament capping protein FliD [Planctomycetes bacterium]|nr:flagellar filament capping protein FliD [Planctomycetota bacterium]
MASGINFSGLASGLDTNAIVDALVAVERQPIAAKQARRDKLSKNIALFAKIGEKLSALRDAADNFRDAGAFSALKATSGDTSVLNATATGDASAGVYQVVVTQLARRETQTSQGYANSDTLTVGTGTLHVTVGSTTKNITIAPGSATLQGVRDAINAADAGVSALVVNDGSNFRLVLTADDGGVDHTVTVDASQLSGGGQALTFTRTETAADAILSVNGIEVHRDSNHVDDIVAGLTFDLLKKTAENTPVTVKVDADVDGLKGNLQDFVKAYNDVQSLLHDQLSFTPGQAAPPLLGDATLVTIQGGLFTSVNREVPAAAGAPASLSSVGIKTSTDGSLRIDTKKLEDAIKADPDAIVRLFTDGAGGLASGLKNFANTLVRASDGLLGARQDGIQRQIRTLDAAIRQDDARATAFEAAQRRKFAALESLLGQLQSQSAALTSFK